MTTEPRLYQISIDSAEMEKDDFRKFFVFLRNISEIDDWHSPFKFHLFIKTSGRIQDIISEIFDYFDGNVRLFVTEMEGTEGSGALPSESWDWLESNSVALEDHPSINFDEEKTNAQKN